MALGFNRKKAAESVPDATPQAPITSSAVTPSALPAPAPGSPLADFDLDDFSALAGTSSPPINASPNTSSNAFSDVASNTSVFEFPETAPDVPLDVPSQVSPTIVSNVSDMSGTGATEAMDFDQLYEIEQRNAAAAIAADTAVLPAPFVPPSASIGEPAVPFYAPQIPIEAEAEKLKKKLPLVPILGILAALALAGGAATYFAGQDSSGDDETAPVLPTKIASRVAPPAPDVPPAPPTSAAVTTKVAPSIAAGANPVNAGIEPAPAQTLLLKALWKRGADAKHRRDYAGARRFWGQGLKIDPNNVGFRQSLAKLPR